MDFQTRALVAITRGATSVTLTADTITEDQLRHLQREAVKIVAESSPYHLVFPMRDRPGVELLYASTYALGEDDVYYVGYTIAVPPGKEKAEYVQEGRRYCAELLNAVEAAGTKGPTP